MFRWSLCRQSNHSGLLQNGDSIHLAERLLSLELASAVCDIVDKCEPAVRFPVRVQSGLVRRRYSTHAYHIAISVGFEGDIFPVQRLLKSVVQHVKHFFSDYIRYRTAHNFIDWFMQPIGVLLVDPQVLEIATAAGQRCTEPIRQQFQLPWANFSVADCLRKTLFQVAGRAAIEQTELGRAVPPPYRSER